MNKHIKQVQDIGFFSVTYRLISYTLVSKGLPLALFTMEENKKPEASTSLDTLEDQDTTVTATPDEMSDKNKSDTKKKSKGSLVSKIANRVNIYLLGFILLIIVSLIIVFVVIQSSNKKAAQQEEITSQELTQEAIDNLSSNEATVGDPKQLLNIESNAVFAGKVLIRDGLDVAGPIKVGGDLNLPGITVSGKSAFDEVQVNSLSIAGDTSVQGVLTVQNGLTVNGKASFAGAVSAPSLTVDALSLTGDLQFARHIDAGGGTPSVSGGGAIGSGGTVTISGTDTAGTVTINVGSGAAAGVLANVTFASAFNGNPHVVITPIASLGSGPVTGTGKFYLSARSSSGFTIATSAGLSSGSISFDFVVID
jgi:cytoskeletal protein CcmA (bactofilin family)